VQRKCIGLGINECVILKGTWPPNYFRRLRCFKNFYCYNDLLLTLWHSWLRHCATSRKVAGSISDGVIGIFN